MHESNNRGFLKINDKKIDKKVLARMLNLTLKKTEKTLQTLYDFGIYSIDENGVIYSRRMVKDENLRQIRAEAGKLGGSPLLKQKGKQTGKQNKPPSSSTSSSTSISSSTSETKVLCPSTDELSLDLQEPEDEFYLTAKKRKLKGQKLIDFNDFWDAFDYKRSRSSAADSWLDIQCYTHELFLKIMRGAHKECKARPAIIAAKRTPKMAQGWLTEKRWEDESEDKGAKSTTITDNNEEGRYAFKTRQPSR